MYQIIDAYILPDRRVIALATVHKASGTDQYVRVFDTLPLLMDTGVARDERNCLKIKACGPSATKIADKIGGRAWRWLRVTGKSPEV